ncbi:MAG: FAD-dependent oxidoreductase [Gammaproteobacteria bacterium]|nr:FAD-dependent oxidoreductase [Gammaproteobacteria bacterium]
MNRQRIAIIGSGISGLTAAYLIHQEHDISVFEANNYIGGHTATIDVQQGAKHYKVDTGFIVCNDRNYPNFLALMDMLGVNLQETEMSFSVRNNPLNLEYNGHNLNTLFSQRLNILRPKFHRLVRDILRFNKAAKAAIAAGDAEDITLDEFVQRHNLSAVFKENYLLPMVAAIWSCSLQQAGEFPLQFFLKFFLNHGLLDIKNRPQWYVLVGGSRTYIDPLTAGFRDRIRLNTPVTSVLRQESHVEVTCDSGTETFDQVIFACHSDQALALLANANPAEKDILSDLEYQENDVILHCDDSLMPKKPLSWASWNFLAGEHKNDEPPLVTYSMNILQGIKSDDPFLVSLNARHKIDSKKIIGEYIYAHPVYSLKGMRAQARRNEISGLDRIHYCGAYWYNGFHEDGVRSALDVGEKFGAKL